MIAAGEAIVIPAGEAMRFGDAARTTGGGSRLRRERALRWLLRAATLALAILLLPVMLELLGRHMLYPAPSVPVPSPPPPPLEEVVLALPSGEAASAWARSVDAQTAPAVLFFHGNGENLETMRWAGLYDQLAGLGVHSLAVDYPGYGRSDGSPSEAGLTAAGEAGLRWLADRHPGAPKIVLGWSLGAAVAVQVAARHRDEISGLALLSAWEDLESLASTFFPKILVGVALADRWDSRAWAPELRPPVLMIHGEVDRIIPIDHGRRLHRELPAGTRFVAVPGAGHNDLLGRALVWEELAAFFRSVADSPISTGSAPGHTGLKPRATKDKPPEGD